MQSPALFRCIRAVVRFFTPKMQLEGLENLPAENAVIVGNHSHMYGPIIGELYIPGKSKTWCIGAMMHKEEAADYAFNDFWSKKPKWNRWFFYLLSRIIPRLSEYIFTQAQTVPVYHDSRLIQTFRESIRYLQDGYNMVIFPEQYVPFNNILWDFQDKFVDLARFHYKKTGECLTFVPMYIAPKLKKVFFLPSVTFDPTHSIEEERNRICDYLKAAITEKARSLPEHIVIPYPNMSKKFYLKNTDIEATYENTCY